MKLLMVTGVAVGLAAFVACAASGAGQGTPRAALPTKDQLLALAPGPVLPGYTLTEDNTKIDAKDHYPGAGTYSAVQRRWASQDQRNYLVAHLSVYESAAGAHAAFAGLVQDSSGLAELSLRSGRKFGEEFRTNSTNTIALFRAGRALAYVHLMPNPRQPGNTDDTVTATAPPGLVEAVSTGLEAGATGNRQVSPDPPAKLSVVAEAGKKSVPIQGAVRLGQTVWAPLAALRAAGAKVEADATTGQATVEYGGRSAQFTAFTSEVRANGAVATLSAPVAIAGGDLIVPLSDVAKLLRIPVKAAGK